MTAFEDAEDGGVSCPKIDVIGTVEECFRGDVVKRGSCASLEELSLATTELQRAVGGVGAVAKDVMDKSFLILWRGENHGHRESSSSSSSFVVL